MALPFPLPVRENAGEDTCTLPTESYLGVPSSVVRLGKSTNASWTRCHPLELGYLSSPRHPAMDVTSSRRGHRLQALSCWDGISIPSDGSPENPWGSSPRGVSVKAALTPGQTGGP